MTNSLLKNAFWFINFSHLKQNSKVLRGSEGGGLQGEAGWRLVLGFVKSLGLGLGSGIPIIKSWLCLLDLGQII